MKNSVLKIIAASLLLSGCSLMPYFERPAAPVDANWPLATPELDSAAAADIGWQEFFVDAQLRQLLQLALTHNNDLRTAVLNIEKAQALYQVRSADLFPTVNANANANVQHSGNGSPGASVFNSELGNSGSSRSGITKNYRANLGFSSYELDFFGRIRSLNEQALQLYLATEEARRSMHIALLAEVANAWFTLLADQQRLQVAQSTLASQQSSYTISNSRFEFGLATALELRQSQITVDAARGEVARFSSQVQLDQNLLQLLIGSSLPAELATATKWQHLTALAELPAGVPSAVLQQRPDVLQAERSLEAANANIGAARAAFFPRVSLTVAAGTASPQLGQLFSTGTGFWNFVPQIGLPIFDAGRNRANLKAAEIDRDIMLVQYQKVIQNAFKEVSDSLAIRQNLDDQYAAQRSLVAAAEESYQLADARYKIGLDNFLTALDAQRTLYAAEQNLIAIELLSYSNQVTLYKVLGGGWHEHSQAAATPN
jgi:multidrug efflux system outer membrane protein